ncbi:NeuD/PglB/VioB family sugar acetyltransferase [Halothiobacillus sp. DCM-1]|uniref:NeuD/PglB/VioB family sugar acetyltransferase n=1 Tax=Halothiobacillus sp. DCM-1 TaxID=3112558 RepID=UPI003247C667
MSKPVVLLGHGDHALVLRALIRAQGRDLVGVLTPDLPAGSLWQGVPVLGGDEWLDHPQARAHDFALGLGRMPGQPPLRQQVFAKLRARGLATPPWIHPAAWVDPSARLADGVQIMAGAVVQVAAVLAENVLINTGAQVDHHGQIGAHVHVAPGAVLCGSVQLGEGVFVGAGAVLIQGITVGAGAEIAAGATIYRSVPPGVRWIPGRAPIGLSQHETGV